MNPIAVSGQYPFKPVIEEFPDGLNQCPFSPNKTGRSFQRFGVGIPPKMAPTTVPHSAIDITNNPWNPGTRYVMSRCEFDEDAITLSPPQCRKLLRSSGFGRRERASVIRAAGIAEWPGGYPDGLEMAAVAGRILEGEGVWVDTSGDVTTYFVLSRIRLQSDPPG